MDTFINAIYLYDDKVLITFNYKEGTETVTFGEATEAEKSSDMSARGAPKRHDVSASCLFSLPVSSRRGAQRACLRALRADGQVQRAVFAQRGPNFLAGQRPHLGRQGHEGGPGRVLRLEAEFFTLWSLLFGHCPAGPAASVQTAADFLCSLSAYFTDL